MKIFDKEKSDINDVNTNYIINNYDLLTLGINRSFEVK